MRDKLPEELTPEELYEIEHREPTEVELLENGELDDLLTGRKENAARARTRARPQLRIVPRTE